MSATAPAREDRAPHDRARDEPEKGEEILIVRNLTKHFEVAGGFLGGRRGVVKAVDDV